MWLLQLRVLSLGLRASGWRCRGQRQPHPAQQVAEARVGVQVVESGIYLQGRKVVIVLVISLLQEFKRFVGFVEADENG